MNGFGVEPLDLHPPKQSKPPIRGKLMIKFQDVASMDPVFGLTQFCWKVRRMLYMLQVGEQGRLEKPSTSPQGFVVGRGCVLAVFTASTFI